MIRDCLRIGAALLLAASACSSNSGDTTGPGFTGTAGTPPKTNPGMTANAGTGAAPTMTGAPRAGTTAPPAMTKPPVTPTTGASGAPAMTGTTAPNTGTTTSPNTAAAGSGGSPTTGAKAGSGAMPAAGSGANAMMGGGFIREAMPTEDSIKKPGEFTVKSYTEAEGLIGGDEYGAAAALGDQSELYYPEGATPPFAAMVIVPGFTAQRSDVAPWGEFLASHGIVSLVIDTNSTSDQPDTRSRALLDAVESLKKENAREGSPMKGKLDTTRVGLMGWSMGGGGTWISADGHPELKVAVSLCGWIIQGVGSKTSVPSLKLAVSDDELAAGMSQPVYAAIPDSTPKMLVEWLSGGHWTNNNPNNQNKNVGRYGLPWIKVFLEKDERYRQFFKAMPMGASDFKTNQ